MTQAPGIRCRPTSNKNVRPRCRSLDRNSGEFRYDTVFSGGPNRLPLPERDVRRVVEAVRPYAFDRIYGGWWQPVLRRDARAVVERSAERYIQWLRGEAEDR